MIHFEYFSVTVVYFSVFFYIGSSVFPYHIVMKLWFKLLSLVVARVIYKFSILSIFIYRLIIKEK